MSGQTRAWERAEQAALQHCASNSVSHPAYSRYLASIRGRLILFVAKKHTLLNAGNSAKEYLGPSTRSPISSCPWPNWRNM